MVWTLPNWLKPGPRPQQGGCAVVLAACLSLGFVALGYVHQNAIHIPPNTLPWEPVDLNAPPGWIAHWQLGQLAGDGQRCRGALSLTADKFMPRADRKIDDACGFNNVVRVNRSPVAFSPKATATCGLTAALFWYQAAVQRAAVAQMHARLVRIDQLGTFACRNINSEVVGNRSEHATANAIDVAGFRFADGRTATVLHDYGKNSPQGRFLDAAHEAACGLFNGVLGPRYNRLHANHFHLDMGPYRICS